MTHQHTWNDLNERQQAYMLAIYETDQKAEAHERGAWNRGEHSRPADEWRWLPYHATYSQLRSRLEQKNLVDPGTGSTFDALAERGLILRRYERGALGESLLFVRITSIGRKLVRENALQTISAKMPKGTLREWHWKALALAYATHLAGEKGVSDSGLYGYGGISWKTWLRLRDYGQHNEDDLVCEISDEKLLPHRRNCWLALTPFGMSFYEREYERYHAMYPNVNAPKPIGQE